MRGIHAEIHVGPHVQYNNNLLLPNFSHNFWALRHILVKCPIIRFSEKLRSGSWVKLIEYIPLCLWIIQIMYCLSDTTTALCFGIAILLYISYTKIRNSSYVRWRISNLFWMVLELLHMDRWADIVTQIDVFLQLHCKCANINWVYKLHACYIIS